MKPKRKTTSLIIAATLGLFIALGTISPLPLQGQVKAPRFELDVSWPKPLPEHWVLGWQGGVCVDARDHVFIVDRRNLTPEELEVAQPTPPVVEFDPEGNVVNSWGDPNVVPKGIHGCYFDYEGNVWLAGNADGIVQKYTHDGSKLLLQIGKRGVFDTSDGTITGRALNSSHTQFFKPAGVAVDPGNGDVYVADGYGNSRVAVFDRNGGFLRQWGRQGTKAEVVAGMGGVFMQVVHCVVLGNDGLLYVCDRQGDRVEVFDKMGSFKRNILINSEPAQMPDTTGMAMWVAFSPDQQQRFMYVPDEHDDQVVALDHASGQILSRFGRPGYQPGNFEHPHALAVDSKGNIYVNETVGRRLQRFKMVSSQ
jgi:DNA-binding beta-propeller fold protein YncE